MDSDPHKPPAVNGYSSEPGKIVRAGVTHDDGAPAPSRLSSRRDAQPPPPHPTTTTLNNKGTIASTAEADLAAPAPPSDAKLLIRSSPTIEDFAKLGAVDSDSDDGDDFWKGSGKAEASAASQQAKRMQQLPPPSPPRRKQVNVGQRRASLTSSSRRKSQIGAGLTGQPPPPPASTSTGATIPFWSLNRMRSSSTDSVRGAFYSQKDLKSSRNRSGAGGPPRNGATLPPSSSAANQRNVDGKAAEASAAAAAAKRKLISKRRRKSQQHNKLPPAPQQQPPVAAAPPPTTRASSSSSNRRFLARGGRVADAGGGGSSSSDDEDDDDRRIAAAELGLTGSFHGEGSNNHIKPKARRSIRKSPRDVPSKIVKYGAAHDDDESPHNLPVPAPLTGGEASFQALASSSAAPSSSYQWTIAPHDEDKLSNSQLPPLRLSIGEEYVPLHPPAAHRSSAKLPAAQGTGSDGSGVEASSSQDDAWSSVSEFHSNRNSEGANSDNPNQSLFRFDGSEQPSATGCFGGGGMARWIGRWLDPTPWLTRDVRYRPESGAPYFEARAFWTAAGWARHLLWNPIQPEFTSLQLFCWAVVMGVVMGFYTAAWKALIEACIEFLWVTVPTRLLQWGFFTSIDGSFPLYHYMWMCPSVWGGILAWTITVLPDKIPDQNDWIRNVHTRGTQDHASFLSLFVLATAGMASGLSLGPELPLVLTAGMAGSWLGLVCKQSVLQARVMNLTAASAAVGGFFGFPMAGALFVLEIPHRMGLQYFEALSPATVSSIVAVLTNRLVVGNDVTGYYSYPFLTTTLPSGIFTSAIVYGFFGAAVGVAYAVGCKKFKTLAHDLFPSPAVPTTNSGNDDTPRRMNGEQKPLLEGQDSEKATQHLPSSPGVLLRLWKAFRIAFAGCVIGAIVGGIGMFIPHSMFWGEAQLQTLIDKGRTPLPVFGIAGEATVDLVALGRCMIDGRDAAAVRAGFGIECSFAISVAKIITTGLSLGTGIVGGHFWGPLFVGCSSGHFLTEAVSQFSKATGYGGSLSRYPCLVILCVMGSAHVVTYRAHMAIMLILTLTISAFNPEDGETGSVAGDYSAVFPLLVVSVFVALMLTRSTVFYPTQRSRGDIIAVPEVLCEPGMAGRPMVHDYESGAMADDSDEYYETDDDGSNKETEILNSLSPLDIEENFEKSFMGTTPSPTVVSKDAGERLSSSRLDELLNKPLEFRATKAESQRPSSAVPASHRRIRSDPARGDQHVPKTPTSASSAAFDHGSNSSVSQAGDSRSARSMRYRSQSGASVSSPKTLVRVKAYGEVQDLQPSLLDQARLRAASSADDSHHKSQGFHSRNNSLSSVGTTGSVVRVPTHVTAAMPRISSRTKLAASSAPSLGTSSLLADDSGALTLDDLDLTFDAQLASLLGGHHRSGGSKSG